MERWCTLFFIPAIRVRAKTACSLSPFPAFTHISLCPRLHHWHACRPYCKSVCMYPGNAARMFVFSYARNNFAAQINQPPCVVYGVLGKQSIPTNAPSTGETTHPLETRVCDTPSFFPIHCHSISSLYKCKPTRTRTVTECRCPKG